MTMPSAPEISSGQLAMYEKNGFGGFPVCIAKTHLSLASEHTDIDADARIAGLS